MAKGKAKIKTVHRSSVDGKFITKKQAEKNPRESVKERIKK
jgi:hypothetical protein